MKVPDKPNPPVGIGSLAWNYNGNYLATKNGICSKLFLINSLDNMPCVLWIWDILNLSLFTVLIQLSPIKSYEWCKDSNDIVITTGTS